METVINGYKVRVYDSPEFFDRFTVCYEDEEGGKFFAGMNELPFSPNMGFYQFVGDDGNMEEGEHLGVLVDYATLPEDTKRAIYKLLVETLVW